MNKYKIVIAPDSFKESVDAFDVCNAVKEGLSKVFNDVDYKMIPMADGGEGTSRVITAANKGEFISIDVMGPLGSTVKAEYGFVEEKKMAVIEVAEGCGIQLTTSENRNPLVATTYGVGEIINDALKRGAEHIIIGLGGSATNDGGVGMMQALGAEFKDINNNEVPLGGKALAEIRHIDISRALEKLKGINIEVACDVENPLVGKTGASYVFAPQKGADDEMVKTLEESMKNYAHTVKETYGIDIGNTKKAGAAGGLGAAFILLNGTMKRGIDLVLKYTDFEEKIKDADFIITGEGSIDSQTKYGKTISGIAYEAKKHDVPVIVIAGRVADDINELYDVGVTAVFGIVDSAKSIEQALKDGYKSIVKTSENIGRLINVLK